MSPEPSGLLSFKMTIPPIPDNLPPMFKAASSLADMARASVVDLLW
jgi:hypothetical protein